MITFGGSLHGCTPRVTIRGLLCLNCYTGTVTDDSLHVELLSRPPWYLPLLDLLKITPPGKIILLSIMESDDNFWQKLLNIILPTTCSKIPWYVSMEQSCSLGWTAILSKSRNIILLMNIEKYHTRIDKIGQWYKGGDIYHMYTPVCISLQQSPKTLIFITN